MHDLDGAFRDAQLIRHNLREHGFMPLSVAVRTDHHRNVAGRVDPYGRRIEQANPAAQHADKV